MFTFFLILVLSTTLFGQETNEIQDFKNDPIVNTLSLPFGFKNFIQDSSSQILLIPSKAANFSKNFIYGTYSPFLTNEFSSDTYQEYPSYSLSYLFGKSKSKWLLRFDHQNEYYNSESISKKNNLSFNVNSPLDSSVSKNSNSRINNDSSFLTRVKLVNIRKRNNGGIAYGVFAFSERIRSKTYSLNYDSSFAIDSLANNVTKSKFLWNRNEKAIFDKNNFAIGFEFSKSQKDWDFLSSLTYNYLQNKNDQLYESTSSIQDTTYNYQNSTIINTEITTMDSESFFNSNSGKSPHILKLNTYFQNSVNWIGKNENYYLGFDFSYSLVENGFYKSKIDYLETETNESREFAVVDSIDFDNSFKNNDKSWKTRLKTGYVTSKEIKDFYFLSGVNFDFTFSRYKGNPPYTTNFPFSYHSYAINNFKKIEDFQFNATIPLYANYTLNKWLSIYGGLNYKFDYLYQKSQIEAITGIFDGLFNNPNHSIREIDTTQKETESDTYSEFYLGMTLKHESGLISHINFNGNISNISRWNISLGYLF